MPNEFTAESFLAKQADLRNALLKLAREGTMMPPDALRRVFEEKFGSCYSAAEYARFCVYAAPMVRRIAFKVAGDEDFEVANTGIPISEFRQWVSWLETMDFKRCLIVDLRYFAGLTVRETAKVLQFPVRTVTRELRLAKAWLRKLRRDR